MRMINNGFRLLSASTIVLASALTMPGVAHAQLFFDWGGGTQKVNDTGRQSVRINSDAKPGEIIVSFTDRKLYLITGPGQAISYPVAIPREQDRWEGKTTVTQKRENPSWTPTPTMIKENPRLPRWVPGGHPMNPLGNRALYLGSSFYRIHGTDAPWTIGTAVSKGCIRMYNKDALDVYERSKVGAKVLVTWNAYQTTADGEAPQAAAVQDDAAAGSRAGGSSRRNAEREAPAPAAAPGPAVSAGAPAAAPAGQKRAESRYSYIFGTPEPAAPAAAQRPAGEGDPARAARPVRERENQPQREPRKSRDATAERVRAEPAATSTTATPEAAGASDAAPVRPKAAEQRQRPTPVETGSLPERRAKPKSAPPEAAAAPAQAQVQAAQPAQPDAATRAVEAAERAAAAAERAAAAAQRAERAMTARAAAPAAPAVAPAAAAEPASGGSD